MLAKLERLIGEIGDLNSKLVLLVGASRSGKTKLLRELGTRLNTEPLNVGLELGRRLAATPINKRGFSAGELLREIADKERTDDPLLLDNLELLFEKSLQINPLDLVKRLAQALVDAPEGPFARPALALDARDDGSAGPLADRLRDGRRQDAAAGRTLSGPHRADLVVTHAAKDQGAALCSTGEQKAMLMSILLAHAALVREKMGRAPLLLLDEVAAHLDPSRRAALFERLAATGSQIWMTGTEAALFDGIGEATRLHVEDGRVSPA